MQILEFAGAILVVSLMFKNINNVATSIWDTNLLGK